MLLMVLFGNKKGKLIASSPFWIEGNNERTNYTAILDELVWNVSGIES